MNSHRPTTISAGKTLVGLTLAAALAASGYGCSSSNGNSPGTAGTGGSSSGGKGGSTAGTGGSTAGTGGATAGTTGSAGSIGGTGGSTAGTGGTATGGSTAGTGGSATAGTGGSTAGTGGSTAGTGGSTGGGGTGGAADWLKLPATLPPTLNPPSGATVKLHFHATGDQIYTCTASSPGGAGGGGAGGAGGTSGTTYSYVLKQPDAKLYDQSNTQVGTHGLGPNWTSTVDNSVVNGAKVWGENATGTIQWLLLRATGHTGTGVMDDVTYVIRANTTGGAAPATGCDSTTAGTDTRVAYTADYYMLNGGGPGAAWMTPPANLPAAIVVPSGATYAQHYHAIGAQVYTCTASSTGGTGGGGAGGAGGTSGTTYAWVLKQPDAALYDSAFTQIGTHGLGPNWTSTVDGSVVVGAKVNQAAGMTGAVPWLLLMATSNTGTGVFSNITYVQRLNTAGGPAPASCDATNTTDLRVPYSADYYFFTGGTTNNDGGTNG